MDASNVSSHELVGLFRELKDLIVGQKEDFTVISRALQAVEIRLQSHEDKLTKLEEKPPHHSEQWIELVAKVNKTVDKLIDLERRHETTSSSVSAAMWWFRVLITIGTGLVVTFLWQHYTKA